MLRKWLNYVEIYSHLLFRASANGWSSDEFHKLCDNKGPTLTIIKANDRIFGGFTS